MYFKNFKKKKAKEASSPNKKRVKPEKLQKIDETNDTIEIDADENDSENDEDDDDEDDDEEEEDEETNQLNNIKLCIKENLATTCLMNPDVDVKQCWQSILMVMKSIIEDINDATLILARQGLSVLSSCFLHLSVLYQNNYSYNQDSAASSSSSSISTVNFNNLSYDICECMQILIHLCEAVKHHLNKRNTGINQIIQLWKEKNELCKRALMLVNFYNSIEVRTKALELVRMVICVSPAETLQFVIQVLHNATFSANSQVNIQIFFKAIIA